MKHLKIVPALLAVSMMTCGWGVNAAADEDTKTNIEEIETITIIGSPDRVKKLPGSANVVSDDQFKQEVISDINQALKTVAGVYVREEDGFGLRPNIGIRTAPPGRSSKVTLMEDGVLIAPAPYSNPAAYYFPTALRMHSVEVLKGAPLLRHGPQTIAGVVNMVSTPIPEENSGRALFSVNNRKSIDLLLNYGGQSGNWGYLFETAQRKYEGFKDIDRTDQDTGFDIKDYVAKLSWQNDNHLLLLKLQNSTENSRETYTGLTERDFNANPNRRYGLTALENMDNKHTGVQLDYVLTFSEDMALTTTFYRNKFQRDWFKTGDSKKLINTANKEGVNSSAQRRLDGVEDMLGIKYKHNNREYLSKGIQTNLSWQLGAHELDFGARIHDDEMDRFQPVELMDQINGRLVNRRDSGKIKSSDNRFETGEALSLWITDNFQANDKLNLNFSLRMEDVETSRTQYGDRARTTVKSTRNNDFKEILAGIGATWAINDNLQLIAGYHQGITPLGGGAKANQDPESSDNLELGVRMGGRDYQAEAILFSSDFKNKAELCSIANPCSNGKTSGSNVIGGAKVSGLEVSATRNFVSGDTSYPIRFAYTYTNGETTSEGGSVGGLTLKDIPKNTLSLRAGMELANGWNNYVLINYVDEMCAKNGCNKAGRSALEKTQKLTSVDLISRYALQSGAELFLKISNAFDQQRVISRSPYGARPNMERTISLGVDYRF